MKFDKPVALNRDTHRALRFRPAGGFGFAAGLHSAPLCASEFYTAAKEYAIVFVRGPNGGLFPVVVLGVKQEENLFVAGDGRWDAQYLPASVRSYPFTFVEGSEGGALQILIDEAYPGFDDKDGIALFSDSGDPAPELAGKLKFLQAHHVDIAQTRRFASELDRLGLLTERSARLQAQQDAKFQLDGIWVVDEAKLATLEDGELLRLVRSGQYSLITAHLLSIGNLALLPPKSRSAAAPAATATQARPATKTKAKVHAKD